MRCGCPHCGTFMIQDEEKNEVCICPNCGYRCNACLGTATVISREELAKLRTTEWFTPQFNGVPDDEEAPTPESPDAPEEF